jgi:uncharacterized MAPEG superfamily protein
LTGHRGFAGECFTYELGHEAAPVGIDLHVAGGYTRADIGFEQAIHRGHQNMLEGLVVFLPSLGLFATYVSAPIAALLGAVFIVGRAVYARLYILDPPRRSVGVAIHFSATAILLLGGTIGALVS